MSEVIERAKNIVGDAVAPSSEVAAEENSPSLNSNVGNVVENAMVCTKTTVEGNSSSTEVYPHPVVSGYKKVK